MDAELVYLGERGPGELLVEGDGAGLSATEGGGDGDFFQIGGREPVGLAGDPPGQRLAVAL